MTYSTPKLHRSSAITAWPARCGLTFALWACDPLVHESGRPIPAAPDTSHMSARHAARGRDYDPRHPFECGEIDLFDLEAIEAGGALERGCSNDVRGTWLAVAEKMRTEANCGEECAIDDPELQCILAECANALFDAGARSTCEDFSPFVEALVFSDACNRADYYRPALIGRY